MADVINDRDTLLLGSPERGSNPLSSEILFQLSANGFRVDNNNVGSPATITITAILIDLLGTVTFTATGATLTDNGDNTATLSYQNMVSNSAIVTASLTSNGQVFTRSTQIDKISDGRQGSDGADGRKYATVYMYQFAPSQPAKPTGTSGYTWATGVNSTYGASDGWSTTVPTNPGGPNTRLYVASVTISAEGAATSTVVNYSTSAVAAWTQNGANGVSGVQQATAIVYQWVASIPFGPIGTTTYTWATGAYAAPADWSLVPPNPPSQGLTLWAARVNIVDSAQNAQTTFNWGTAAIYAAGSSGANGAAGPSGASFVIAYAASSSVSANSAPASTTGKNSVPATNSGGIVGTYTKTVPALVDGQRMFQVDGIYDPTTNLVTWSVPYWSVFKVGSLSAIVVNTGDLTVTGKIQDGSGNWYVDSSGKMFARNFEFRTPTNELIMRSDATLVEQVKANPNLAARLSSWGEKVGGATVTTGLGDDRFINGEFLYLPINPSYVGINSNPLNIPPNAYYTVSFDAYCEGAPRTLSANLYGSGLDTAGYGVQLTNTIKRYKFSERMPNFGSSRLGYLRLFSVSSGSGIAVANVKVEIGVVATPWNDNVITPSNSASYVMPDSITNVQFGGDLSSTNWNGSVGPGGAGWLLQRSGTLYAGDVRLRGNIAGGSFTSYAWPAAGLIGYYIGAEGGMWGNFNNGRFFQITASGDVYTPSLTIINGQVSIKSADSGQRTEIDKNGTRVYASNGQLLVRLGVW